MTEELTLWQRWRNENDEPARQALLALHLPYAKAVAAKLYAARMHDEFEFDEYLQFATLALIESMERYDPQRGAQFRTYAHYRMTGAIISGIESLSERQRQIGLQSRLKADRLTLAQEGEPGNLNHAEQLFLYLAEVGIGLALGAMLEGSNLLQEQDEKNEAWLPDQSYERIELKQFSQRLRHLLRQLTEREGQVIEWHYLQAMCFDEIAQKLGISKARVSQLHYQGLQRLRRLLSDAQRCSVAW